MYMYSHRSTVALKLHFLSRDYLFSKHNCIELHLLIYLLGFAACLSIYLLIIFPFYLSIWRFNYLFSNFCHLFFQLVILVVNNDLFANYFFSFYLNHSPIFIESGKCNFPLTPHVTSVGRSLGWLVSRSVIIS